MSDKHKMPVDGSGTEPSPADRNGELASRRGGPEQTGESGGGPYPNPHTGKEGRKHRSGKFKGGQSDQAYYGEGQLGEDKLADNENAPSTQR